MVLEKPQGQDNHLPPPRTLIMDFTMTHVRFQNADGVLKETVRIKIRHYRNIYLNRPDPIAFLSLTGDISDRLYDDVIVLRFLHTHHESSVLTNELTEESDQFRFLRTVCLANLKGSVGLILVKTSVIRIAIPVDLSSRSFYTRDFLKPKVPSRTYQDQDLGPSEIRDWVPERRGKKNRQKEL